MPRVLINALGATMGGAMRHLVNFLPELGLRDDRGEYLVLVRDGFPELKLPESVRLERVPGRTAAARIFHDVVGLPRRARREAFAAIVSLTNFGPVWSPVPHVLFQRNSLYYCESYLRSVRGRTRAATLARRSLALASMKRADVIVVPSDAMGSMIKATCPGVAGRTFRTLYHGFSRASLGAGGPAGLPPGGGFKLLYPTHAAPHKGFDTLFEALGRVRAAGIEFVLYTTASPEDWPGMRGYERRLRELALEDRVVFLGRTAQERMGALYADCDLMVYPSLCESFGFSMVEAMGHGLPVVAAGTAVNREICRDGALYYEADDPREGAEAIVRALQPDVSRRLVEAGRQRMESFDWSWGRYAGEFVEILRSVV